jgi:Ni/Co efflux regulator RcnB
MKSIVVLAVWATLSAGVMAQSTPAAKPAAKAAAAPDEHAKKDITRHRAMAAAHEAAARCLEAGKDEETCQKELQAACKGLAIGKYCGMRHEH